MQEREGTGLSKTKLVLLPLWKLRRLEEEKKVAIKCQDNRQICLTVDLEGFNMDVPLLDVHSNQS